MQRIIFIPGILSSTEDRKLWNEYSEVPKGKTYYPYNYEKIYDEVDEMCDSKDILLIGHSFGGLIGKLIANKNNNVKRLVTMATPSFLFSEKTSHTFGGYYDIIVPYFFSHQQGSYKNNLNCSHCAFSNDRKIIEKVLTDSV